MSDEKPKLVPRWYFGGLSAAGATCFTHPLDSLKVQMQTQKGKNISLIQLTTKVIRTSGVTALYNGISASLARQLTYSTTRFAIYEALKNKVTPEGQRMPFGTSLAIAGLGGFAGGFVGNPSDVVNVRMQNDVKLSPEKRRNYKHVIDGILRVSKHEGIGQLWAGWPLNCFRSALMTIGQVSFYEKIKYLLLLTPYFEENFITHVTASLGAGGVATALTQPVDVLKTRAMNAKKGEVKSLLSLLFDTAKEGPQAFFKGFCPAFVRLAPHTILTFLIYEFLTEHFGVIKRKKQSINANEQRKIST